MDVWWNNLLPCKDLESSNWNNQLVIQSSNFKSSNWQLKQQVINDNWLFPGWFLESSNLDTTIHTPRKINMEPQKKKKNWKRKIIWTKPSFSGSMYFYVHLRGCFFSHHAIQQSNYKWLFRPSRLLCCTSFCIILPKPTAASSASLPTRPKHTVFVNSLSLDLLLEYQCGSVDPHFLGEGHKEKYKKKNKENKQSKSYAHIIFVYYMQRERNKT